MAKKTKSIMQDKESGQCYLCRLLHKDYAIKRNREEHHVMGGIANRKLSEKYGLKVYLDPDHHRNGQEAVHKAFMRTYPELDFREIFGKNYLTENELAYEKNRMAYKRNMDFRRYVDRYCESRNISREEALRHNLVDEVRQQYEEE